MNNSKIVFNDTHTHLYLPEFSEDIDVVIYRAQQNGISKFFLPNIDSKSLPLLDALVKKDPSIYFPMLGLHPCSVNENFQTELLNIKKYSEKINPVAIGEIGIDLYWDKTFIEEQKIAFREQIAWAKENSLPIVIHCREAFQPIVEILHELKDEKLRGIFHCFGGSKSEAEEIISLGFYLGIGGVLTYKKSGLAEVLKEISLDHLVLETDSPYLTPVPYRGKRNESSYIKIIAKQLAEIKECSIEKVAEKTTENSFKIFGV